MSAPRSTHAEVRRRVALLVERDYQPDPARCVAAIVKLLTYRPMPETQTADQHRPLGAGARPTMHETRHPQAVGSNEGHRVSVEDGHREPTTPDSH